jgi:hypothetical protein
MTTQFVIDRNRPMMGGFGPIRIAGPNQPRLECLSLLRCEIGAMTFLLTGTLSGYFRRIFSPSDFLFSKGCSSLY